MVSIDVHYLWLVCMAYNGLPICDMGLYRIRLARRLPQANTVTKSPCARRGQGSNVPQCKARCYTTLALSYKYA